MSLLNHLEFQPIDSGDESSNDLSFKDNEKLNLNENIDEKDLDDFWDAVEKDIQNDPEWFNFSD